MKVVICPTPADVARTAASVVALAVRSAGPEAVLGVATGSSPLALYEELAAAVRAGELDLSHVSTFALDEYVGLPRGHRESYAEVLRRTVTEPLGLDPAGMHSPDAWAPDPQVAAAAYEQAIHDSGGVDVQILGIGANGHIGFNEPSSSLGSRTRMKTLTARTRRDNARFFRSLNEVPHRCLTQGLATILDARQAVLVAQGEAKAWAVAATVEGPLTSMVPGSVLQLHEHATVVVDEAAARQLRLADYYREAYGRPDAA